MIVRSQDETIVRYNRSFILTLKVAGWLFILLAAACLYAAYSKAIPWLGALCFAVMSASAATALFSMARPFSQTFVAIGPEGIRLALLKFTAGNQVGFIKRYARWTPLPEQRFKWEEISEITYDSETGVCRFRARNFVCELTDNDAPSPRTVARLMAARKGVELPAQESSRSGERSVPRLTQAAIAGGISLPLMGAAATGAWWFPWQTRASYAETEFGVLVAVALFGICLFITAIVLVLIEVTHRPGR